MYAWKKISIKKTIKKQKYLFVLIEFRSADFWYAVLKNNANKTFDASSLVTIQNIFKLMLKTGNWTSEATKKILHVAWNIKSKR